MPGGGKIYLNEWEINENDSGSPEQIHHNTSWKRTTRASHINGKNQWHRIRLHGSLTEKIYMVNYYSPFNQIVLLDETGSQYYSHEFGTLIGDTNTNIVGVFINEMPLQGDESWLYYKGFTLRFTQPIYLFDSYHLSRFILHESIKLWVFIGICFVVIFHTVFLWVVSGNKAYIFYSLYVFITCLTICGFTFATLVGEPGSFIIAFPFLVPLGTFLIYLFTFELFESKANFPRTAKWIKIYALSLFFSPIIAIFTSHSFYWNFVILSCFPVLATIAWWGVVSIIHKRPGAIAYTVGWACFLISILFYSIGMLTNRSANFFNQAPMFGVSLEMLIMTIAIGEKVKYQKNKNYLSLATYRNLQDLVQVLCHDLANPLAVIGSSALISHKKNPDQMDSQMWEIITKETRCLSAMIEKVRFIEALSTNKMSLQKEITYLEKHVHQSLEELQTYAEQKSVSITCHWKGSKNCLIIGDDAKTKDLILKPLIHNAIKYSFHSGKIEISITPQSQQGVTMGIKDYGVGIPDYIVNHLLEGSIFHTTRGTDNEESLGLSLVLAKTALSKIGGNITIRSKPGHYTEVEVYFKKVNAQKSPSNG